MPIIEVENLTKDYRLGQLESLKTTFFNQMRRLTAKSPERRALFKALDDVSFTIEEGEVVGVIGHNGAGKSTLLKLLANITTPTSGRLQVNGRIAPLIEVSAGFVPDLTGRENIYLNGSILGLGRKDIARKFDEIVQFAEMEQFIDTPVKRYSSGMKVKLAFSVATSLDSEILIVDEVLAVGDLAFQRKCFERMEGLIKSQGRTVFLVSHNLRHVERMCTRVLLLQNGKVAHDGDPREVTNKFYEYSDKKIHEWQAGNKEARILRSSGEFRLRSITVNDGETNSQPGQVSSGGPLRIRVCFELLSTLRRPEFVVGTHTTDFIYLTSGSTNLDSSPEALPPGIYEIEQFISEFPLRSGTYCIRLAVFDGTGRSVFQGDTLATFSVQGDAADSKQGMGMLNLRSEWRLSDKVHVVPETT